MSTDDAPMDVLIVDDEEEFAATLAERLRLRGFGVQIAGSGEAALACIEDRPPRVVLLDVQLPDVGGLEILQRLRSERPGLPVILLTGKGGTKEGLAAMHLGAFDFLIKPVVIEELIAKMRDARGNT